MNAIGWATVARFAGLSRLGALGVGAAAGFTVSITLREVPPNDALIVDDVVAVTALVATVKLALAAPPGTVTLAGTLVAVELSESDTTAPPPGAGALSVTVPVEELPPTTVVGLTETADRFALAACWFTVIALNWNTLSIAAES